MTADTPRTTGEGGKVLQVPVLMSHACTKRDDLSSGQAPPETYKVFPIIVAVASQIGIGRSGSLTECSVELSCKSRSLLKICSEREQESIE